MRSSLLDVVAALNLSHSIFKTIKRNLIWACIYNVLAIPLAMGVFLPVGVNLHPMMAGAAMAFSSVSVVGSSLALRWWKRPRESVLVGERDGSVVGYEGEGRGVWRGVGEGVVGGVRWVGGVVSGGFGSGSGRRREGYSQLPVEMSETV